ncbi:gamma-glutamylcyclotransferase [Fulvimarina endophytica]|uniref:Gamma-glutamylcyclotransferase n=1 Tax=Fulvimarina endophytica TaxID=2293836 RepID=A0A371X755_9HYPH|nr:gamma-glutamylcyclotransferase family protein [Fulvimarina endophytica]RFC65072.1 gamma-glutamylcyclotransferase [Fulvimarina endophytica]
MTQRPPIHPDAPELAELAAEGRVVAYFGYGSLVNPRTLRTRFLAIRRAAAFGWQRVWLPRSRDADMALLSVQPAEGQTIQGVVVYDLIDNLPSVDQREASYERRTIPPERIVIEDAPLADVTVNIYEAEPDAEQADEAGCAILQSYLDAVMQGFRDLYGEEGLRAFVEHTQGFETRLLADRKVPRYPRSVTLRDGEAELFDRLVFARGAMAFDPS